MKEKNNKEIVYLLVCLVVVTLIYLLNHFTLYTSDDFVYRFIYKEPFPSANEQPVRSLFDLHTHTVASGYAYSTLKENLAAAKAKGLMAMGTSDHSPGMPGSAEKTFFQNYRI